MDRKIYCFDIDGTICNNTWGNYEEAQPWMNRIKHVNNLYDEGHYIIYFTARAMGRFAGDPDAASKATVLMKDLTTEQLNTWGCKYHELILGKPHADLFIDDKGMHSDDFFGN